MSIKQKIVLGIFCIFAILFLIEFFAVLYGPVFNGLIDTLPKEIRNYYFSKVCIIQKKGYLNNYNHKLAMLKYLEKKKIDKNDFDYELLLPLAKVDGVNESVREPIPAKATNIIIKLSDDVLLSKLKDYYKNDELTSINIIRSLEYFRKKKSL